MKLIIGRGKARKSYEIPCANIINRADPKQVNIMRDNICEMLGVIAQPAK